MAFIFPPVVIELFLMLRSAEDKDATEVDDGPENTTAANVSKHSDENVIRFLLLGPGQSCWDGNVCVT